MSIFFFFFKLKKKQKIHKCLGFNNNNNNKEIKYSINVKIIYIKHWNVYMYNFFFCPLFSTIVNYPTVIFFFFIIIIRF